MSEHLDIMDPRRGDLFADATHHDCEHYLSGTCENEEYVVAQLLMDAKESNPDADFSGMTFSIRPEWGAPANRCPGFMPSFEFLEELDAQERDAEQTRREDLARLCAMGRIGADFNRALNLVKGA
jgi:hypothetical protein